MLKLIKKLKYDENKESETVEVPKGDAIKKIGIHIKADAQTTEKTTIKEGGIFNLLKNIELDADGNTLYKISGKESLIKDMFDYAQQVDLKELEGIVYIDLEDENITDDGVFTSLLTNNYENINLSLDYNKPQAVGSDITLSNIIIEIYAEQEKLDDIEDGLYEEYGGDEQAVAEFLSTISIRKVAKVSKPILQKEDAIKISVKPNQILTGIIILTEDKNGALQDTINALSFETDQKTYIQRLGASALKNIIKKEYGINAPQGVLFIGNYVYGNEINDCILRYSAQKTGGTAKLLCSYIEADDISVIKMGLDISDFEEDITDFEQVV
jgi:hypothetical protein